MGTSKRVLPGRKRINHVECTDKKLKIGFDIIYTYGFISIVVFNKKNQSNTEIIIRTEKILKEKETEFLRSFRLEHL